MTGDVESRYFVEAAAKVLDILEAFAGPEEELSITEVAWRTGSTYSSAFRLLYTLEKRGYVMRRQHRKLYMLAPSRQRFRIGCATLQASAFQREVTRSIVSAAQKSALDLLLRQNDQFNLGKALANARELLAQKIDLLIEYQFNDTAAHLIATECHKAGVPVVTINSAQPGAYYFGGNNYLTGTLAGGFLSEYAQTHWKGARPVCLILPAKGLGAIQEARRAGVLDSLRQGSPRLRRADIRTTLPALTTREAAEVTRKLLAELGSGPRPILIVALTDALAIGAERALREKGITDRAAVIGHGGGRDVRQRITAGGAIKASVAFFPENYGPRLIALALSILEKKKMPLASYTDHVVLKRENLKDYY